MKGLTGIVPILLTPFTNDESIDYDSLHREVDRVLQAGVHGIGIAIGSEVFKLTPTERLQVLRAVVDQISGEVPIIMNTSAPGTEVAVRLAVEAAETGATRLMIWPPDFFPTGPDAVVTHLTRIADASSLPIVLQDVPQSPISPALALRIADSVPLVDTIKVETQPNVEQVDAMAQSIGDRLSILGGAGGGTLVEEFRRGARGTMPFASQAQEFMAVWSALQAGDMDTAEDIIESRILPVSRLGFQGRDLFYHVHKSILVHQGLFQSAKVRMPTAEPDKITRTEIARLIDRLNPQSQQNTETFT
jgi:4-hydroxy-tetrahydrodipicolinate synthase